MKCDLSPLLVHVATLRASRAGESPQIRCSTSNPAGIGKPPSLGAHMISSVTVEMRRRGSSRAIIHGFVASRRHGYTLLVRQYNLRISSAVRAVQCGMANVYACARCGGQFVLIGLQPTTVGKSQSAAGTTSPGIFRIGSGPVADWWRTFQCTR